MQLQRWTCTTRSVLHSSAAPLPLDANLCVNCRLVAYHADNHKQPVLVLAITISILVESVVLVLASEGMSSCLLMAALRSPAAAPGAAGGETGRRGYPAL